MPRRPPSGSSESSSQSSQSQISVAKRPPLRQLVHDLTNALGGARLRWTLLSTSARLAAPDAENLDALGRLLAEACALTEQLQVALAEVVARETAPAKAGRRRVRP
ncbi:MAG TPA: hypothetical protein VH374_01250 [Polyangia bacterium]|jgi:hypothetical protein|nr:hypothetical protein [Polyangia bacterium]